MFECLVFSKRIRTAAISRGLSSSFASRSCIRVGERMICYAIIPSHQWGGRQHDGQRRRNDFLTGSSPHLITPRDSISRSASPHSDHTGQSRACLGSPKKVKTVFWWGASPPAPPLPVGRIRGLQKYDRWPAACSKKSLNFWGRGAWPTAPPLPVGHIRGLQKYDCWLAACSKKV